MATKLLPEDEEAARRIGRAMGESLGERIFSWFGLVLGFVLLGLLALCCCGAYTVLAGIPEALGI